MTEDERRILYNGGGIVIKRNGDGFGFELVVPLYASETDWPEFQQRCFRAINAMEPAIDSLIVMLDSKWGYKGKKKQKSEE